MSSHKTCPYDNFIIWCSNNEIVIRTCLMGGHVFHVHISMSEHEHLNMDFSVQEVPSAIRQLKLCKAPGSDRIYNEFLVQSGNAMISWLTSFFNACYRVNVIGLLKPGKHETSPQSYWLISLLCSTYKLMEHLLLYRINPIIDPLLPNDQAGFRQGRSTVDQVVRLTQSIEQSFHE